MLNINKIIFLDIDGVLNNKETFPLICCKKVNLLKYILEKTHAKIVLSSTWRYGGIGKDSSIYEHLIKADPKEFVFNAIIDCTPKPGFVEPSFPKNHIRGHEIQRWIEDNDYNGKFCIIDDDNDMLPVQKHYLVQTDTDIGLLRSHVDKVIKILND